MSETLPSGQTGAPTSLPWLRDRDPHRLAVIDDERALRHDELEARANQLAHHLKGLGVGPGKLVGVCLGRSVELVVGLMGVLKAGAAYVPLDPEYPTARLAQMLEDVAVLLTESAHEGRLPDGGLPRVRVDLDGEVIARCPRSALELVAAPESLAYVIYTSGSTGRPKGVMVEHRQLRSFFSAMDSVLAADAPIVWGAVTSVCFDISILELLYTLSRGQTVVVVPGEARTPAALATRFERHGVTHFQCTPSLATVLTRDPQSRAALSRLAAMLVGGEAFPAPLANQLKALLRGRLLNMYGPTETTIWSTCHDVDDVRPVPIGRPLGDTRVLVVDEALVPVAAGVTGELLLGGSGVARGYLNRAELTDERFRSIDDARFYRTGDLVRIVGDGLLEYVGRADHQVKVRGHRLELGEVEAKLLEHPELAEVAVVARGAEDKRLYAYVVAKPGAAPTANALRDFVSRELPEFAVPSRFISVAMIPRTLNGKLDRKALPDPDERATETVFVEPQTALERKLADAWARALKVERVGLHDRFMDLGGDSLLALRILTEIRELTGVELAVRRFFEAGTVGGLARLLDETQAAHGDAINPWPKLEIDRARRYDPFPLTDVQQAYWSGRSEAYELGRVSMHSYMEVELGAGQLDLPRLQRALDKLVARHEMMRAVLLPDGRQRILEKVPRYEIPVTDLRGRPRDEVQAALEQERARLSHQVLSLLQWPLFELRALVLDEGQRLLVSMDGMMFDAGSVQIMGTELATLYADVDAVLPPLELSFRDYAIAEAQHRESAAWKASFAYWQERLETLPPAPELPVASVAGVVPRFQRRSGALAPELWAQLKRRAMRGQLSPSGCLLAAYAEVLAAFAKHPHFTLNLTLFNRLPVHPQVNDVVGDFTSLVLLEVDGSQGRPFIERARAAQAQLWADLDHRQVSGVRVLRELAKAQPGRALAPYVFTSTLGGGRYAMTSHGALPEERFGLTQTPQVLLDHMVGESPEGALFWTWDGVESLFPAGMLDAMLEAYQRLLETLAEDEAAWTDRRVLTPPEQAARHAAMNATTAPIPPGRLEDGFLRQVAAQPDAVAVISGATRLTYGELHARAIAVAERLVAAQIGRGELVAVVMEKGWEQVVGLLGILYAGGAYVPVDPTLPPERLGFVLANTEVRIALSQSKVAAQIAWPTGLPHIAVDTLTPVTGRAAPRLGTADDLAYVIFTSGSTGTPKGVVIDHRGAVNTIVDVNERFSVGAGDRVLGLSGLYFDLSVYDVFGTLAAGGRLVLPAAEDAREARAWAELFEREEVTVWNTVPALMEMFVDWLESRGGAVKQSLRVVMMSGDWIPPSLPDRIKRLWPAAKVISLGGATEASIWSILYPIERVDPTWRSIPYGHAMKNQSMFVLDSMLETRPDWVPGEVFIGGIGVAKGYWKDEEKTAAKFVAHPRTGERLYRTGDWGRYLPDGEIEFLGRDDLQVKIRGYRIELGEIEAALATHPQVREAVVVAVGEPRGSKRLVACVLSPGAAPELAEALRAHVRGRLAEYMVPGTVVLLDALPRTPTGKLDRRALVTLAEAKPSEEVAVLPSSPDEVKVAQLVAEVLELDQVGADQTFYDLGGDSLLGSRLLMRVQQDLGVEVQMSAFFRDPTVAGLARLVAELRGKRAALADDAALLRIEPRPSERFQPFPLTEVQQAYWLGRSEGFELGSVAMHSYYEIESEVLDLTRLERAIDRMVERHELLRTIVLSDGRQQILERIEPCKIARTDLRGRSEAERAQVLLASRERLSHQLLPTDKAPLFELEAFQLDERRLRLHLSLDEMMWDFGSEHILARELALFYDDPEAPLPPLTLSFRDYVIAQQAHHESATYKESWRYWKERLETLPPAPELPVRKNVEQPRFRRRSASLSPALWAKLKRRAAQAEVTPSGCLLAAYAEVLAAFSKHPRFIINLTLFNRPSVDPEIAHIVGDFMSLVLLEVDGERRRPFLDRVKQAQAQLWSDLDHRRVSGVRILRELAKDRPGQALAPVVFTSTIGLGDFAMKEYTKRVQTVHGITQTPQVLLDHVVKEAGGALKWTWDAVEDAFPPGVLDAMFDAYRSLLERLAAEDVAWGEVRSMTPPEQRARHLARNATDAPIPDERLEAGFLRQLAIDRTRTAVVSGLRRLSYDELHRRARQVGQTLTKAGVGPNQLVAVVMEKGWEQVVGLLGILYAGGAYVPVDPALPAERIQFLLETCEVKVALTQSHLDRELAWPAAVKRVAVDQLPPMRGPEGKEEAPRVGTAADLAYVIFTSGSTGTPKGVVIDHRGAVNTIADVNERFAVGKDDRVLGLSGLYFDLSVYDVFGTLAAGARLVLPAAEDVREPRAWGELFEREKITVWNTVPALMEMFVDWLESKGGEVVPSLRVVMMSGDWIPLSLPERIKKLWPEAKLMSLGGATEASIWSILYPIEQVDPSWRSVPYGHAMKNQRMYVLDGTMETRPDWVPGEVYIGGIGVAKGYWKDEEKTAAKFVTHPRTGERLYRTGDWGRYMADGEIEFLGRDDLQVKIRGYRIELGEIEAVLGTHPAVREAVVVAVGDLRKSARLVAYVVRQRDAQAERFIEELDELAKAKLPGHMVPAVIVELEALPHSVNGKIDRRDLRTRKVALKEEEFAAPTTPEMEQVAQIWAQVLRLERVSVDAHFFDLGGNSLLASQVLARVRQGFGVDVTLRALLDRPTVAALADAIEKAKQKKGRSAAAAPIVPVARTARTRPGESS